MQHASSSEAKEIDKEKMFVRKQLYCVYFE